MSTHAPRAGLLADSIAAHVLQFGPVATPMPDAATARRLLWAFVGVAGVLFAGLRGVLDLLGLQGQPGAATAFVVLLMVAFVGVQRGWVGAPAAAIGLRPWHQWSRRERLYALQVVPLAALAFAFAFQARLGTLLGQHGAVGFVIFSLLTGLLWGALQEGLYRGWLQTALERPLGPWGALLAANLVFTFGPLHTPLLLAAGGPRWPVLAAVFAIGLFFGLLRRRSGNLWLPALLHGLWPLNMA